MIGVSSAKTLQGLRSILAAVTAVGVLLSASCAPAVDTDALAKELTQLDDDWSKVAATKNADAVASFYAADAIAYPPNEPAAIGQAAAKAVWASYFADSTFSISWKTEHAGVSKSGDLGFTARHDSLFNSNDTLPSLVIETVAPGKPFDQAGLRKDDAILVDESVDIYELLEENRGRQVTLNVATVGSGVVYVLGPKRAVTVTIPAAR